MAAVAQQMQSTWEKKRKEKETKYFQEMKASLDHCVSSDRILTRTTEFREAGDEMNALYEKFVMDCATVEDEIRKLWEQLLSEQRKLLTLAEQKHKRVMESENERERGQVQGMAIAKRAIEDFNKLVTSLREIDK
ncbi:hypothetical protein WOLCODRAFT_153090 [Wolfiporia cocos MD-104 SS10]|uniref:Uncharacterized protein n=1 Tax=Wolfiporia cocos (strain MD-104) TaxID=742152 RepID=A0A2H3JYS8_WOLCO|nr:hypothetical protein WOLCODRAFT_153090 [Wolfiporia cocos MD-104 SS10]